MIAIVVSRADSASEHVGEHLLDLAEWTERSDDDRPDGEGGGTYYRTDGFELRTFEDLHIHLDRPADAFTDPDLLVVVSRHAGETGPLLTAHFTGNVASAEYGGDAGEFARACPNAAKAAVDALHRHAPEGYEVGIECTHHGPTSVGVPSMFVELGSDESEWSDPAGARAVARAVLDLRGVDADREKQVAGFGGGHYAPRYTRVVEETEWAVGHVAADWGLQDLGDPADHRDVVRRMVEASATEYVLLDGDRPALEAVCSDLGYRVVSETWLRETGDLPLSFVAAVEDALGGVAEGLRFGEAVPAVEGDGTDAFVVTDLPTELLDDAYGFDPAATREAVGANAVAFGTVEGGTRPRGRVALADADDYDPLVDALVAVVREKYDAVDRRDDEVLARVESFDPAAARERGVPEGPAFGRLSAGETVEVDGERVDPESVHTERVERFPID